MAGSGNGAHVQTGRRVERGRNVLVVVLFLFDYEGDQSIVSSRGFVTRQWSLVAMFAQEE